MKIGITCYPTYGGSGVVATELGLELAQRGHEVHFISYAQPIRLMTPQPNIHYHEVEVSRYPLFEYPPYDLALATRMAETLNVDTPAVNEQLGELWSYAELTRAGLLAAEAGAYEWGNGVWFCDDRPFRALLIGNRSWITRI